MYRPAFERFVEYGIVLGALFAVWLYLWVKEELAPTRPVLEDDEAPE